MQELRNSIISDVWEIFENISKIPHGSGNEKKLSDWICSYVKNLGYQVEQDEYFNIFTKIPASSGYEIYEPIILQSHLDMVNEKNSFSNHNFLTDELELYIEDGYLKAKDTTLGADNGIGVAMILAYISRINTNHPPLEIVFTTQEETTMAGAKNFDGSKLSGHKLISLDNTNEHEICIGCAGIVSLNINKQFSIENSKNLSCLNIHFSGLVGGHSGDDIHKRKSSFIFATRTLLELRKSIDFQLSKITLGQAGNSIAREFDIDICLEKSNIEKTQEILSNLEKEYQSELLNPNINIKTNLIESKTMLTKEESNKLIDFLISLPNGMQTMTSDPELAESSLNIGIVKLQEDNISFVVTIRSSVKGLETYILEKLNAICKSFDFNLIVNSISPFFNSNPNSELIAVCKEQYSKVYNGKQLNLKKYHAMMELGIFEKKINNFQGVLLSPELIDIHSPNERLNIKSTERTFEFLSAIIENCKFKNV